MTTPRTTPWTADRQDLYGIHSSLVRNIIGLMVIAVIALKIFDVTRRIVIFDFFPSPFTEFMVNFQGGFVRRGLLGEILYQICLHTGLTGSQLYIGVSALCLLVYGGVVWFFIHMFRKRRMCWWLVFSTFLCGYVEDIVRKDFLLYGFVIAIVWLISGEGHKRIKEATATAIIVAGLFLHEAFIFYGAPLFVVWMFRSSRRRSDIAYSSILTLIILATFGLLSIFKGTQENANAIVASWSPLFPGYPEETGMGTSVKSLGWNTIQTFGMHLSCNFDNTYVYLGVFYYPAIIFASYYLMMNFPMTFRTGQGDFDVRKQTLLSALIIASAFFMLPMLTVLSCDASRNLQYIFMTSFIYLLLMPAGKLEAIFPARFLCGVERFNRRINSLLPPLKGWLLIMFFFMGVWFYAFRPDNIILENNMSELIRGSIQFIHYLKSYILSI